MKSRFLTGPIMVAAAILFGLAMPCRAQIAASTMTIIDDSSQGLTFKIGGPTVRADFDTSITYDAVHWDEMTVQSKFTATSVLTLEDVTGGADSGAVTVVLQMSNDMAYWTPIDSLLEADSLAAFKQFTLKPYRWARFVTHHAVKTDSAGSTGSIRVNVRGKY